MRVKGGLQPSAFTLEDQPKKPGYVLARFYENAVPYTETRDGLVTSGYEYDEYDLELPKTLTLESEIESQYETYLEQAKTNEIQRQPFDALDYRRRMDELGELSSIVVEQAYSLTLLELGVEGGR